MPGIHFGVHRLGLMPVALVLATPALATPALATPPASPPTAAAAPVADPAPALALPQALILIRASLIALQQAGETGDYQVLNRLGSRAFQAANPPEKLAALFAKLRAYNLNAVLVLNPVFTQVPRINAQGMLEMKGAFAIDNRRVDFLLIFQAENGRWKLFGIGADVR